MEDAVYAGEVERVLDEVDLLDRETLRVLLLQRRVVVVRERVPADGIVAAVEERAEQVRADEAGRAGDDVAHGHGMLGEPAPGDHEYHVAEPEVGKPRVDTVAPPHEARAPTEDRETVRPYALDDEPALLEHRPELRLRELAMREGELGAEVALADEPQCSPPLCIQRPREESAAVIRRQHDAAARREHPGKLPKPEDRLEQMLDRLEAEHELELRVGERKTLDVRALELDLDSTPLGGERRGSQDAFRDVDADEPDVTGRNAGNSSLRTENLRSRVGSGATGTVYCSAPRRSYTSRRWSDGAAVVMRARQAYSGNLRRGRIAQTDNVAA